MRNQIPGLAALCRRGQGQGREGVAATSVIAFRNPYGPARGLATVGLADSFASTTSTKPARSYSAQTLSSQ